ncbi:MAG: MBOAT family protein [Clostridia bacterium]|nr:MBOAT family protein [Clostridia bacterium]
MAFTSLTFIIFAAITVAVYALLPQKAKHIFLIAASLVFYFWWKAWAPVFIIAYALFNYFMALAIAKSEGSKKRILLFTAIGASIILFFIFRYHILDGILSAIVNPNGIDISILFPLGFSYYMFKSVSYLIDVNNKTFEKVNKFDYFLLYVVYFPEVSMGPITRAVDFVPQISKEKSITAQSINKGLVLVAWGFFKKIIFADRLASLIAPYYSDINTAGNGSAWFLIAAGFLLQLYLDFSAYTDISVGVSKMLGYEIKHNFKAPFFSYSIPEFWRKWHISLTSWLLDYVFTPLQFLLRSLGKFASIIPAIITFTLIGVWHGGTSAYLMFGFLMGLLVAVDALIAKSRKKLKKKMPKALFNTVSLILLTIINIIVFLFMRVPDAQTGLNIIVRHMFDFGSWTAASTLTLEFYIVMALSLIMTIISHILELKTDEFTERFIKLKQPLLWIVYLAVIFAVILFGHYGPGYDPIEFIYMGF